MRKNRMMRLASALLILTMVTTCAISGTFAKYVTTDSATDTARVAKWGVEITANGTTFATQYTNKAGDNGVQVKSDTTDKVVAPGTWGELVECTLAGTPEVAVSVTYDATLTLAGWTTDGTTEYCPVYFTVNGETYGIQDDCSVTLDNSSADVAALITAVEEAIEDYSAEYGVNQNLSDEATVATPDVSWHWEFVSVDDTKDTALGDAAADGTPAVISLTVATTVTQLD